MRKTHKQKKIAFNHKRHVHITRGLIFGLCFGGLVTAVGIAQLLAAPFIGTSLTPSSQNASPNQTKTITVFLNSGNQDVNGGYAQVSFDSSRLGFAALEQAGGDYRIIQQQVTASSVSFEYQSIDRGGTDGQFNIANIKFTVKPVSGTHTTNLSGSAGAYEGRSNPEYYPASSLSASIRITGSSSPAPSPAPPSPAPSPAPSPSSGPGTPAGPASPVSPSSNSPSPSGSNNPTPGQPASPQSTDNTSAEPNAQAGEAGDLFSAEEGLDGLPSIPFDESSEAKSVSIPPAAIIGTLILVADALFYLYYRRHKKHKGGQAEAADYDLAPTAPEKPTQSPPPKAYEAPAAPPPPPPSPVVATPQPASKPHTISGLAIKQAWGDIRKEQAELIAHGDKDLKEDRNVPDMFELANQHPESFGSQSLYDKESGGKPNPSKSPKS